MAKTADKAAKKNKQQRLKDFNALFFNHETGRVDVEGQGDVLPDVAKDAVDKELAVIDQLTTGDGVSVGEWLTMGPNTPEVGIIKRAVLMESTYFSDKCRALLAEHGYTCEYLRDQGLILSGGHLIGLHRTTMAYLAKTLVRNPDGSWSRNEWSEVLEARKVELAYGHDWVHKDKEGKDVYLSKLPKSHRDGIWLWVDDGTEDGNYLVHPAFLLDFDYQSMTEDEEAKVMKYLEDTYVPKDLFKDIGAEPRVLTGFGAVKNGFRYALVMPNFKVDVATGKYINPRKTKSNPIEDKPTANNVPETAPKSIWGMREYATVGYVRTLR